MHSLSVEIILSPLFTNSVDLLLISNAIFLIISITLFIYLFLIQKRWMQKENQLKNDITSKSTMIFKLLNELNEKNIEVESLNELNNKQINTIKILNEENKRALRIAEEADLLKSNFLANMSHEIRTPMNGILGFAQLMQGLDDSDSEKRARYLDIITHNGVMLVNLIDDIIDLAKIEAGQLALNKTQVNIDDIMFDLYTFFNEIKYNQEKEHITIRILNLNDDENNIFYTDGMRVRQIMSNLISNALKFTEEGVVEFGYVNLRDERKLRFYVKDTGIGIPHDKLDIIFDRFRQVEEGSTRKYGGTGIGLFISKHLVQMLGGDIWVETEANKGSVFYFELPYASMVQTNENTNVFKPITKEYTWENKCVLIAEDVETNFQLLRTILEPTKIEIVWARDGEEAVKLCQVNGRVDLVLMDIQMPKMNGYEATAKIKELFPNVPVIAQTAYAMPNDNIKCLEEGCDDYIPKPINSQLLLTKINKHLFKYQKSH